MDPMSAEASPALKGIVPIAAGIVASRATSPSDPTIAAAVTFLALCAAATVLRRNPAGQLLLLAIALAGTGFTLETLDRSSGFALDPREYGTRCVVIGEAAGEPDVSGRSLRFVVRARRFHLPDREVAVSTLVAVTIAGATADNLAGALTTGIPVAIRGVIDIPPGRRNPGEFDTREYLRATGIDFQLFARGEGNVVTGQHPRGGLLQRLFILPARRVLLEATGRCVGGEEGEFLKGLLVGERSGITPATRDSFVITGVAHILAVSGSNVVVIAGIIIALVGMLRAPARLRGCLVGAGLLWYMVLTGAQPPVVRATIMALAALFASIREEKVNALNSLGFSGILVLGMSPRAIFDVGFQLSYAAVLSLVLLTPVLLRTLDRMIGNTRLPKAVRAIETLCSASLAATLGTLPFIAASFGRVSVVGIAVNAAVVPASGLAVVLGVATTAWYPIAPWCAAAYGCADWLLLKMILLLCRHAAEVPFASVTVGSFSWIDAIAYYTGLTLAALHLNGGRPRTMLILFPLTLVLTLLQAPDPTTRRSPGKLRVSFIDVGQGDAMLLESPGGKFVLIDAGPAGPGFDAGERSVVPFLRRRGIDSLAMLVVTHLHNDHAGGVDAVLRAFPVGMLVSPASGGPSPIGERGLSVRHPTAGESLEIDPSIRIRVLSPEGIFRTTEDSGKANESSLVLQIRFGETALLCTGDAGSHQENVIIRRFGSLIQSAILKVGHHGASTGTGRGFLEAVAPRIAVLSVGRNNRFGHPSCEVIGRLEECRSEVLRTDRGGAVILESDGREISVVPWR